MKNNLSLESQRVTLDTKKRKSDLVWNQFVPTVDVQGILARSNRASTSIDYGALFNELPATITGGAFNIPYTDSPQWSVMGNLSASLTLSFALFQGIRAVREDYRAGTVTLEKARLQTERDVRKAYNQILLVEAQAALQRESFATAERRYQMAEANYRGGLAPRLTSLQAQVAMENMKPSINETDNSLKALYAQFAMTLGLPFDTQFTLTPLREEDLFAPLPLDARQLIDRAAAEKPDILELQGTLKTLQIQRKAQALQLYTPYVNFAWSMTPYFLGDPWKDQWFKGDNWFDQGKFSFTLGMNLNGLFPFTKEGQALKDLDSQIKTLTIGLAQAVQGAEIEIYTKVNALENTRTTAEAQELTVKLAEESYRLTEEAYRAGLQDFIEVQNAALSLSQAKLQLLSQRFTYLSDLTDLEYAAGLPFGSLSAPDKAGVIIKEENKND